MPIDRRTLEEHVALVNQDRKADMLVRIESYDPPGKFVLSFPNRELPEGQCIDQDFTEIQFALHERVKIDTGIQSGRHDPESDRYFIEYEVIEWD